MRDEMLESSKKVTFLARSQSDHVESDSRRVKSHIDLDASLDAMRNDGECTAFSTRATVIF